MYKAIVLLALSALSTAIPQPQGSTSEDVTTTQASKCPAQPAGAGPVTSPDTASDFLKNPVYSTAANGASTPGGYVQSFVNLQAATSGSGYLGYSSIGSYDPQQCANLCANTYNCVAFNIYFERDPSVDPSSTCPTPDPPSTVNIKCAYFGSPITASGATNTGQYRNQFHVVIAGSNGYSLASTQVSQPSCTSTGIFSLYYYGSGFLEQTTAPNYPKDNGNTINYNGADVCQALQACLRYYAYGSGAPPSFEIYRTSSTANWVCQAFLNKNTNKAVFNVPANGAVAYGYTQ